MSGLAGTVAVITGGASGFGRETALRVPAIRLDRGSTSEPPEARRLGPA